MQSYTGIDLHSSNSYLAISDNVEADYGCRPGSRNKKSREHFDRGTFPRSVGTEEAKDLTIPDMKNYPDDSRLLTKLSHQVHRLNGWIFSEVRFIVSIWIFHFAFARLNESLSMVRKTYLPE
jgi:hypothetical protein